MAKKVKKTEENDSAENRATITEVNISEITISRDTFRSEVDEELVESIKTLGLLNPVVVNDKMELVNGGRRYAAVTALGWKTIPVTVYKPNSSAHEELAHIDENLVRKNLIGVDEDDAIARRKEIYEELNPGAKKGGDRKSEKIKGQKSSFDSFVKDTAKKTGQSESSVKDAVRRSEKASPRLRAARETGKITATQATEIVKLDKKDQDKLVPHLEGRSISETKHIIELLNETSIDEICHRIGLGGDNLKQLIKIEHDGNEFAVHLLKISDGSISLSDRDIEEVHSIVGTVNDAIDAFDEFRVREWVLSPEGQIPKFIAVNRNAVEGYLVENFDGIEEDEINEVVKEVAECSVLKRRPQEGGCWDKDISIIEDVLKVVDPQWAVSINYEHDPSIETDRDDLAVKAKEKRTPVPVDAEEW